MDFREARVTPPVEIIGPLRANVQWQATEKNGYALTDFAIDRENQKVTCPAGKTTTNWYQRKYTGAEKVRVQFRRSQCKNCENQSLCTRSGDGRSLSFSPQIKHDWLAEQRTLENTQGWRKLYSQRAGIEGTFSQVVRTYDLRQTRYIGEKKTHLHNIATAPAINITLSLAWLDGKPREKTRTSRFARLRISEC